jgi:hypothetical protein
MLEIADSVFESVQVQVSRSTPISAIPASMMHSEREGLTVPLRDGEPSGRWCYFRDSEGNIFEPKERR